MSIPQSEYSTLPEISYLSRDIQMPLSLIGSYQEFKAELVLQEPFITAANAGVLTGKLCQFTSGQIYDEERIPQDIHNLKIDALKELMEEAGGEPVLIFYNYKHEVDRILKALKGYECRVLRGKEYKEIMDSWNAGKLDALLVNPASAGHGLNLQSGGHICVFFSLPNWNLELYEQAIARLYRQGQSQNVLVYHLILDGTIDEVQLKRLQNRSCDQKALLEALECELYGGGLREGDLRAEGSALGENSSPQSQKSSA